MCIFDPITKGGEVWYPLVNIQKAMENGPSIVHLPIKMVVFHSYVSLPEGNVFSNSLKRFSNPLCQDLLDAAESKEKVEARSGEAQSIHGMTILAWRWGYDMGWEWEKSWMFGYKVVPQFVS